MATGATALIGIGLSLVGSFMAARAQQRMIAEQTAASKRAENARQQQMQLDGMRRRRQSIRQAIAARSQALTIGTAQGAGGGSGIQSAMGGAMAMGQENQNVVAQSEVLGGRVFDANRDYFDATQRGQAGMAFGQGIASLGGAITRIA